MLAQPAADPRAPRRGTGERRRLVQPPFAGEIVDGCLWGRGAVDMKDFDAMLLSVVRARARAGRHRVGRSGSCSPPTRRPAGRRARSGWCEPHPELLEGCSEAIGEVGGFSLTRGRRPAALPDPDRGEGMAWLKLIADGQAGHGSFRNPDNAVTELAAAVARIGAYEWPHRITDAQRAFLEAVSEALDIELDPDRAEETLAKLGSIARMVGATMSNTANPTMLKAGYKHNVIPGRATAAIDGRIVPGGEDEFFATITDLLATRSATRCWATTRRWRPSSPVRWSRRCSPAWSPRIRAPAPCRTCERRDRRQGLEPTGRSAASASRRSDCRPTWTSSASSTGWTNACRLITGVRLPGARPVPRPGLATRRPRPIGAIARLGWSAMSSRNVEYEVDGSAWTRSPAARSASC